MAKKREKMENWGTVFNAGESNDMVGGSEQLPDTQNIYETPETNCEQKIKPVSPLTGFYAVLLLLLVVLTIGALLFYLPTK